MRKRGGVQDHEAAGSMRSEFLALCDGLLTNPQPGKSVTILACTNRPFDLDEAFLRRLPRTFLFDLPTRQERVSILKVLLASHALAADVSPEKIAGLTDQYSGSDLKEVCKIASARPLRRLIQKHTKAEFERVMSAKGSSRSASRKASTASEGRSDAMEPRVDDSSPDSAGASSSTAAPPAASPSSADPGVLAAAGLSSASSSAIVLADARPMRLKDFEYAIRSIRPSGIETLARLRQFEAQHRMPGSGGAGAGAATESDEDEEDDESGHESEHEPKRSVSPPSDSDEDEIYR